MDTSSPAAIVNAEILSMFVGRRVRTIVHVQCNEGGVFVGQSTDGHQLSIKSAMDVPVSHFMEVYGIAENNQTIRAEVCTDFGPSFDPKPFDGMRQVQAHVPVEVIIAWRTFGQLKLV